MLAGNDIDHPEDEAALCQSAAQVVWRSNGAGFHELNGIGLFLEEQQHVSPRQTSNPIFHKRDTNFQPASTTASSHTRELESSGCGVCTHAVTETWEVRENMIILGSSSTMELDGSSSSIITRLSGILADDMGMGKTIQVIAYLCGLFVSGKTRHILIGMPLGLLETWKTEFKTWFPNMRVKVFHGPAAAIRRELNVVIEKGGILLTTYDKIRVNSDIIGAHGKHIWDYIILDEGHYIKNQNSQKYQAVASLRARHKLLLSGTPIQNNVEELWSLFDWVCDGKLLSNRRSFMKHFGSHIRKGEARDATLEEKQIGNQVAQILRDIIAPHFIRREKTSLLKSNVGGGNMADGDAGAVDGEPRDEKVNNPLGSKTELAVWVALSPTQLALYKAFLADFNVFEAVTQATRSPLSALGCLKKICDHPALLSSNLVDCAALDLTDVANQRSTDTEKLLRQGAKTAVAVQLLHTLRDGGHRTLVVASSRTMVDLLERCILASHSPSHPALRCTRIDGTVTDRKERQLRINLFNSPDSPFAVFLLTTQVAIGITLTGADRVLVYDPSWNPKRDAQAVDRAYRVGQTRDVVVYRLVTCGTLEEKIYRNQVRKDYLAKTAMEHGSHARYFTEAEMKDMFVLGDTECSETRTYLDQRHSIREEDAKGCRAVVEEVEKVDGVRGVSRHDRLYTDQEELAKGDNDDEALRMVTDAMQRFSIDDGRNSSDLDRTRRKAFVTPRRKDPERFVVADSPPAYYNVDTPSSPPPPSPPQRLRPTQPVLVNSESDDDGQATRGPAPIAERTFIIDDLDEEEASPVVRRPRGIRQAVLVSDDDDNDSGAAKDQPGPDPQRPNKHPTSGLDVLNHSPPLSNPVSASSETPAGADLSDLDVNEVSDESVLMTRKLKRSRRVVPDSDLEDSDDNGQTLHGTSAHGSTSPSPTPRSRDRTESHPLTVSIDDPEDTDEDEGDDQQPSMDFGKDLECDLRAGSTDDEILLPSGKPTPYYPTTVSTSYR
ncbi:DNA excision repair protein ERCC-6-like [Thoreauomyces humboldtii]|nr:DNA excision repair protein ERCC-6-like [Thoreauomyces humboldtii]